VYSLIVIQTLIHEFHSFYSFYHLVPLLLENVSMTKWYLISVKSNEHIEGLQLR
jgi:hypothetical protein